MTLGVTAHHIGGLGGVGAVCCCAVFVEQQHSYNSTGTHWYVSAQQDRDLRQDIYSYFDHDQEWDFLILFKYTLFVPLTPVLPRSSSQLNTRPSAILLESIDNRR